MLLYPLPDAACDLVSIDLLQLPQSQYGSRYLLACVDNFLRYVVLAPLKDRSTERVAHALATRPFRPISTSHVIISDYHKCCFRADTLPGQTLSPLPVNIYLSFLLEVCLRTACA